MIRKLTYIESSTTSPFENLAMEEYLLLRCEEDECILYLWQNERTVVIGKNQNPWKECYISRMQDDGVKLVRRLSGGGAVYHDLGNLNFSFILKSENYDVERQMRIIENAIKRPGIRVMCYGRNDILMDGKKVSGNAYFTQDEICCHHGTIMVNVDIEQMDRYLDVPKDKLKAKGVESVKARVGNLKEWLPELTVEEVKKTLLDAFQEAFGLVSCLISENRIRKNEIDELREKYMSWEWTYGRRSDFQKSIYNRFVWGSVEIQFQIQDGKIGETEIFTDALCTGSVEIIKKSLAGALYSKEAICSKLMLCLRSNWGERMMIEDILFWIKGEEF